MGLFDSLIETGLSLYDKTKNRETLPVNERAFLSSFVDKSRQPFSEKDLSTAESEALRNLVLYRYKSADKQIDEYLSHVREKLGNHVLAVKANNKDKQLYPEIADRYKKDFQAISMYKQGVLTPEFVEMMANLNQFDPRWGKGGLGSVGIPKSITYENYPEDPTKYRNLSGGDDPLGSLSTFLGQFNFDVDSQGNLVISDSYDFNPPVSSITGQTTKQKGQEATADGSSSGGLFYNILREYAGKNLPPEKGRKVQIKLKQPNVKWVDPFADSFQDSTK